MVLKVLLLQFFERKSVQLCFHTLEQAVLTSRRILEGTMKTQAGWSSLLAIHQILSLRKHFLPPLSKSLSHHHQVSAMNFRSLLYRELLWNFPSSPGGKRTMNRRRGLMMTSVPLLNNFSACTSWSGRKSLRLGRGCLYKPLSVKP